jgi:AcrR family transcriptional regulator
VFRSKIAERNDPFHSCGAGNLNGALRSASDTLSGMPTVPLSGRRAQAARNDEVILDAAREVFIEDPGAPIAAVAQRAGVGISALYRRYKSKEELLQKLCADGLDVYISCAEAALEELEAGDDPREVFARFMRRVVDADTHSLTMRLAGTFHPTDVHQSGALRAAALNVMLIDRLHDVGAIRPDLVVADLGQIFEMVAAIRFGDEERRNQLRHRYLGLLLDGMLSGRRQELPGPPPAQGEFASRWVKKADA